jgi:uncharacterized protein with ATP-grasp and redox domains
MNLTDFKYISAEDPNTFARFTIEKRIPSNLDQIIASDLFDFKITYRLTSLKHKIKSLKVQSLDLEDDERSYWEEFLKIYDQKSILEIPFFFSEMYFYRHLLNITEFSINQIDPFSLIKNKELAGKDDKFDKLLTSTGSLEDAILVSLAGNKTDLSQLEKSDSSLQIIVNDTKELIEQIKNQETVHIILDNAGTELFSDFLLVKQILASDATKKVILYLKKLPLLVSDATMSDIDTLLNFLNESKKITLNDLSRYLNAQIENGSIEFVIDSFWNSPNHFTAIPDHMQERIKPNDVVISKGDANYRRFYEDRMIPPTYEGAALLSSNQFAIRTLKSEITAGLKAGMSEEFYKNDPKWMVNGKFAVIQKMN